MKEENVMKKYTLEDLIELDLEGFQEAEADESSTLDEYPPVEQEDSYGSNE